MTGIKLLNMERGDHFKTLLTGRTGRLDSKEQYCLEVTWDDERGPSHVHRELEVEPWARGEA